MNESQEPLTCQRELFSLDKNVHYLNCAAYSPILTSSKLAGISAMEMKCNPQEITPQSHFDGPQKLRAALSQLVNAGDEERIALFSSMGYGMSVVANNLHRLPNIASKKSIVILQDEFPNDTYSFTRVATHLDLHFDVIAMPEEFENIGDIWNARILAAINDETALVVVPQVHWIFGVVIDVKTIATKCKEHGALLAIDGTQSVGAYPFDIQYIQPDALIVAGYKWCFAPYATAFGYFGPFFDDGVPLEESWMNRVHSENFSSINILQYEYRPKAQRYNMGEFSSFIHVAMMQDSVQHLVQWGVHRISDYVRRISVEALSDLKRLGCSLVSDEFRAPHLFGVMLPDGIISSHFVQKLKERNIVISLRGKAVRLSLNVFNNENDLYAFVQVLQECIADIA